MPDWISHIILGLIVAELFPGNKKSLIVLGSLLPDILLKAYLLGLLFPVHTFTLTALLIPFHTPIGMAITSLFIAPFFKTDQRKTYISLFLGWASHLLLDMTNHHAITTENLIFFPFSWRSVELGLFSPTQYYIPLFALLIVYLTIQGYKKRRRKKT